MIVNMREAYLKVLGLDQQPLDEKKQDDELESSAEVETCEKCGKVHEGACKESMVEKEVEEELSPKQKKIDHNKNGKIDGEDLAKLRKESIAFADFAASLAENGFSEFEIDAIISKLHEKKHVGTDGPDAAEQQELGDNLSDGEIEFVDAHEIEVVDGTPEKPDHDEDTTQATAPTTKGVGSAEVDGQKIVKDKPEVAVKSQATAPKTK
jgi:hypothetical protein